MLLAAFAAIAQKLQSRDIFHKYPRGSILVNIGRAIAGYVGVGWISMEGTEV